MNKADDSVRNFSEPYGEWTEPERKALQIRRSELTWSECRVTRPASRVRVGFAQLFWAAICANIFLGVLLAILLAIFEPRRF